MVGLNRRIDDLRLAPIVLPDSPLDRARDGDELIHPIRRDAVPPTKAPQKWLQGETPKATHAFAFHVPARVPEKPSRRETVTDMLGLCQSHDAMPKGTGHAEHHVVAAQVQALKAQGIQGQEGLMPPLDPGEAIQKRGPNIP